MPPRTAGTQRILTSVVPHRLGGRPLCEYLAERFSYCSREEWAGFAAAGRIQVNGQRASAATLVTAGDRTAFDPPETSEPPVSRDYAVVYADARVLVVNKPPLLPIHPSGRFFAHTLWYMLQERFGNAHIITRLDRETSGLVLAARSPEAAGQLHTHQQAGAIDKQYTVLVHGEFPAGTLLAEGWLSTNPDSVVRKKRIYTRTKPAQRDAEFCSTTLQRLSVSRTAAGIISRVQAVLHTGRTHQIRAVVHSLGYPVVGDKLYGLDEQFFLRFIDDTLTAQDRQRLMLNHQALHCHQLGFPGRDAPEQFTAAPPESSGFAALPTPHQAIGTAP